MNKKKLLTLVLTLALIGAVGVGATLAYFTDKAETTNVVNMGHVDIVLTENGQNPGEGMEFEDVVPNKTLQKDPTITVDAGSLDCYVRASVTVEGLEGLTAEDGKTYAEQILGNGLNIDKTKWCKGSDNYYYYNEKMSAGDQVKLFTEVTIPEKWGKEVVDKEFKIIVKAEAIQFDAFTPTKNADKMITAWNYAGEGAGAVKAEQYDDDTVTVPPVAGSDENVGEVTQQ